MTKYIDHHVHTCNSLLDGLMKIDEYVNFGAENNFPALFISDHGNMDGAIQLYIACKEKDIKPIIGSEFYVSEGILDKENEDTKRNHHLCLYAKNFQGYKNLVKLTTWANLNNFYAKPRITFDILKQYHEGLVCTTACIGSQWGYLINHDMYQEAGELAYKYKQLFGDDFYIEFGLSVYENQIKYCRVMKKIADMLNIKTVIGNDVHYLRKEDFFAHKIIICKGFGKTIEDSVGNKDYDYSENYYKTAEEITEIFKQIPEINTEECFKNTYEIINKCEKYEIKFGEYIYPELPNTNGLSQDEYLFNLIKQGCIRRYNGKVSEKVLKRIQYEFSIIQKMKFCGYFNMVHDYINWAKANDIKVGPARGCLTYNTPVVTDNGVKNLGEIKVGDKVITDDGKWNKVLKTHVYDCDEVLYQIKTWSSSNFVPTMTYNHKVLVIKQPFANLLTRDGKGNLYIENATKLNKGEYLNKNNLQWIEAKDIQPNDYVVRPIIKRYNSNVKKIDLLKYISKKDTFDDNFIYEQYGGNQYIKARVQKIPRYINIDDDFMFILGYFIGDGWISSRKNITFACHIEKDKFVQDKIYKYFSNAHVSHKQDGLKKVNQVSVYSRIIYELFKDIIPKYAENKLIPEFILGQDKKLLQSLFDGLIQSDGSYAGNRISYDSINLQLINQVRYLGELLGYTSNIQTRKARIDSRGFNNKQSYKIHFTKFTRSLNSYNDGEYVYCKVMNKNTYINPDKKVYDITVENNHNYQTLDFIVHNSCAGCLIAYIIGITEVDSLEYDLFFERFLNPDRVSFPDIDTDYEPEGREKIIQYLTEKYGQTG